MQNKLSSYLHVIIVFAVHYFGCPVVSRVTFLKIFRQPSIFCAIFNDVIRHMRKDYRASGGFRKADI